jgi:hypothetical protein
MAFFLPVSPECIDGPPVTKGPSGFTKIRVFSSGLTASSVKTGSMTAPLMSAESFCMSASDWLRWLAMTVML